MKALSPNNQSTKAKLTHVGILLLVSGLTMFFYGRIDYTDGLFSNWDLHTYREMADASPGLASDVSEPFAYRILGPYLVGLLPVSDITGFYIFSVLAAACLVILFYLFLCWFCIRADVAVLTTVLFMLNKYFYGFLIWNYFHIIDLLGLICLLGLIWTMLENKWGYFCFILFLGSLTREFPVLMVPVSFVYLAETGTFRKEWWKVALAAVPGLVVLACLRLFIEPSGGVGLIESFRVYATLKLGSFESWYRVLINSYIPFSFIPLIFARDIIGLFRSRKYMLLFVFLVWLSSLFGGDYERLQGPTFIIFYLAVAYIIQKRLYSYKSILVIFLISALTSSFSHYIARYPLPNRDLTISISVAALVVVSAVSIATLILNKKKHAALVNGDRCKGEG